MDSNSRHTVRLPPSISPLLTTAQLMAYYGVSVWTIHQWVKRGLPVEPVAIRGRRFDLAKCQAWQRQNAA